MVLEEGKDESHLSLPVFMRAAEVAALLTESSTAELWTLLSDHDMMASCLRQVVVLFLTHCVSKKWQGLKLDGLANVIAELFDAGALLICIDGLDEAAAHRELLERSIDQAVRWANQSSMPLRVLVSTREHSYDRSRACRRLHDLAIVKLQPLDDDRQLAMITRSLQAEMIHDFRE